MQTIQAMFIGHVFVGAFFDQHLANFNISVKRRVMHRREVFIEGLEVHPVFDDGAVPVLLTAALDLLFRNLEQPPEDNRLVFNGCLMNQGDSSIASDLPYFYVFRQFCEYTFDFLNLFLLLEESFS